MVPGRVAEQEMQAGEALQKNGHTVAMTGDGVNDVPRLRRTAASPLASGSQAACQIAQLVLLNSDFQSMPAIVGEGRRVINNIQRAASLFLVKNIFPSCCLLSACLPASLIRSCHLQLSLIGSPTIGIPSFFLALEPNSSRVEGHFYEQCLLQSASRRPDKPVSCFGNRASLPTPLISRWNSFIAFPL